MVKLYKHQHKALSLSANKPEFAYFMEMGTGKTLVTIKDADRAMANKEVTAALIICPNNLTDVWAEEIAKWSPLSRYVTWPRWESSPKIKQPDNPQYYIVNTEAFSHKSIRDKIEKIIKKRNLILFIAVDESQYIKRHTSKRSKSVQYMGDKYGTIKRILTGTPITKNLADIYSQFRFLKPKVFGTNFYAFRNTYIEMGGYRVEKIIRGRLVKIPTQITGYKNIPQFKNKIKQHAYSVQLKDCVDLPDKIYQKRIIELNPEQLKYYKEMRDNLVTIIKDESVSAQIILTKILRLQQIASGFTKTDTGNIIHFGSSKVDAIRDIIEEVEHNVLIFVKFIEEVKNIKNMLVDDLNYTDSEFAFLDSNNVSDIITRFEHKDNKLKVLIANQESAVGYTAISAKTIIYMTNSFNYGTRVQSEARAHRIGQTAHVNYIDIIARNTIDTKILDILKNKQNLADVIREIKI